MASEDDDRVVVVGSGPCGAAAAAQLVARGVTVTLLDAGPRVAGGLVVKAAGNTLFRKTDESLLAVNRHADATDADWYSSLSLGGLSNYWTAAVPRFAPDDFTEGARLDERYRWPITYEDLEDWYEHAEALLTVTAGDAIPGVPSNVAAYHRRLPPDWSDIAARVAPDGHALGVIPMAKGRPWMVARRATEFNSMHCVVAPLEQDPRFTLVSDAFVTSVESSSSPGGGVGVHHVDSTGSVSTTRGRAVVLAAGAVDTTAILLRSVDPEHPEGLGNSGGLVGRYLHDHPRQWWTATTSRPLSALAHPVYVARDAHESSEPLLATSLTIGLSSVRERVRTLYRGRTSTFGVQVFGTMVPRPDVGVALDRSASPDARPTITLRYDDPAVRNVTSATDRLGEIMACAGVDVDIPGPFHEIRPGSSVHLAGTVRMHADPEYGVVDAWNRLFDAPDVVVTDLSCFTTGPEKNPTLTAMAIAMRAADGLASRLSTG